MADQKLENLAYRLKDLNSLRNLFSELNFDFEDKPVDKDNWSEEQKKMVKEARIIASKNEYYVYYIQTDTDSMKEWKGIASKIIKDNHGLCMICSHNPSGFKWVFSSLSKEFSKSFSETRHVPIDVKPDTGVPKTFVDFLEKIRINKDSTALSIVSKMSDAFDSFAIQIHDELTVNVFEALKTLSEGIILDKSNNLKLDERTLEEIRESTFILLYRIMFILYAEDRAVFPDEKFYQDNFSLKWIRSQWILKSNEDIAEYTVHERLKKLFRLIEIGSEGLDYDPKEFFMRSYYGRLFDRKIHYKLEEWKIPNKNLLSAIDYLTRTQDKKGNYFFLDYAALETRHLGAIYEHLLEYHLTVKDGKVSDLPNPKERKTTGSYYTPKYIVDYIVENTVGPLIDDIIKNTSDPGEQVDKILALNILDPAMGSGHFLVGATNYIAGRICEIEYKDDITEQVFVECKRDVARRCIYGVDINPLAVDLASVSLWLETLSSEKPLSFLSAHLKSGNSLMGSSIEDIFEKQTTLTESTKGRIRFKKTVRDFIMLEMLEDDTSDAVKTKTTKYNTMQSKGTVYSDLKFMLNAKLTKSFGIDVPVIGDFITKIGENSLDFYSDERWQNVKECASEHSFFHWDLEFPDIFYGEDGKRQKNPGFDGVVGNPPYGAKMLKQEQEYYKKTFPEIGSTDSAQLMIYLACNLLCKHGRNGFIIPKSFTFASNWKKIRAYLTSNIIILIDCKKVWKEVKLEQIVYIYQNNYAGKYYLTGSRIKHDLITDTKVNKKECTPFDFLICGINQNEILLGQKIYTKSEKLKQYIKNTRGCMLQSKIKKNGSNKVFGGSQIQRYRTTKNLKGYMETKDIVKKAYVKKNSILAQRIVAHIANPVDHLKITATIPQNIDFIILDTVNQIIVDKINPHYVLGLLNSKIINWYAYRFIFAKAIRTMQFDNPTTDRIPIIISREEDIIKKVKKLLKLHTGSTSISKTNSIEIINNELNYLFYNIFNLNDDEIKMIEESTPE